MHTVPTMARQAQSYFAAATSSALLVGSLVAAFVVLTMTSSLRSFPVGLSSLPIPSFGGSEGDAAAAPSGAPAKTSADGLQGGLPASFGVDLLRDRSPAASGQTRPDRSNAASPTAAALEASSVGVGTGVASGGAAASAPAADGGSSPEPNAETSFAPGDPVATLPVEPPTSADPPAAPGDDGGAEAPPERAAEPPAEPGPDPLARTVVAAAAAAGVVGAAS